jgi:hypothetical protein
MATVRAKPGKINHFKSPVIKQCNCKNEQQDDLYGKNYRLFNHAPSKGSKPKRYRCTVCLTEREF